MVSNHFAESGKVEKLPTGPIICPSPGPTLHAAVAAPVKAVVQSSPINARPMAMKPMVMVKKNEKVSRERTISSSSGWPLYCLRITARGWINCSRLLRSSEKATWKRKIFKPPAVDPEQPPTKVR
ncbi:hypothetical protein D9M73_212410 [compost metagenome]